jgi:hypothetical protein
MIQGARYVHTNLIARNWRALANFYQTVFGCAEVPPERDYSGPVFEAGTGVPGAKLQNVHLRLPGYGDEGPTLQQFLIPALSRNFNGWFIHAVFGITS